jgi:hypothetical protein
MYEFVFSVFSISCYIPTHFLQFGLESEITQYCFGVVLYNTMNISAEMFIEESEP